MFVCSYSDRIMVPTEVGLQDSCPLGLPEIATMRYCRVNMGPARLVKAQSP